MLVFHGDFSFKCVFNGHRNSTLLIGDSLLKNSTWGRSIVCFPGARTDDILAFFESQKIRNIVSGYSKVVLFFGRNSVNDFPKQGVTRQAETPSEVLQYFQFHNHRNKETSKQC